MSHAPVFSSLPACLRSRWTFHLGERLSVLVQTSLPSCVCRLRTPLALRRKPASPCRRLTRGLKPERVSGLIHTPTWFAHDSGTRIALVRLEKSRRQWFVWQAGQLGSLLAACFQENRGPRRRTAAWKLVAVFFWPFNGSIFNRGVGRPDTSYPQFLQFCPIHCLAQSQQRRRTSPQNVTRLT